MAILAEKIGSGWADGTGRRGGLALARAAFALVHDDSANPSDDPLTQVARIAASLDARLPEGEAAAGDRLYTLNTALFHDLAFVKLRDPHDPQGLLLHRVLARRAGHPVALALLYLIFGRILGLRLRAVAMPGNLLIRVETVADPVFVDPAAGGTTLEREDLELMLVHAYGFDRSSGQQLDLLTGGIDDREVLVRLLAQLKQAYLRHEQPEKALRAVDSILFLRPDSAAAHRERAYLLERLECREAARADYRRYLELAPRAVDRERILARIARLQRQGVTLH